METGTDLEKVSQEENAGAQADLASAEIQAGMANPIEKVAATGESAGLIKAMWEAAKPHLKTIFIDIQWKDAKAIVAGAFSLVPFLGTAKNVASAAEKGKIAVTAVKNASSLTKDMTKEAKNLGGNTAKSDFLESLKAIPRRPEGLRAVGAVEDALKAGKTARTAKKIVREAEEGLGYQSLPMSDAEYQRLVNEAKSAKAVVNPAVRAAGKAVGLETVRHVARTLDPYPDVPKAVTTVTYIAEFVLPGASLISSLWQLGRDSWERSKAQINLGKDVGKVVVDHVKQKFALAKTLEVQKAARTFMPAAV